MVKNVYVGGQIMIIGSFSKFECFKRCPMDFKAKYIDKIPQIKSEACARGISIHEAIASKKSNTPQTRYARKFTKKISRKEYKNIARPDELALDVCEAHVAITRNKAGKIFVVPFLSPSAYFRGILDLLVVYYNNATAAMLEPTRATIIDWKTGKSKGNRKQLLAYVYLASKLLYLDPSKIEAQFCYVDKEKMSKKYVFTLKECQNFETSMIADMEMINTCTDWNPRKNHFCNWCSMKDTCIALKTLAIPFNFMKKLNKH